LILQFSSSGLAVKIAQNNLIMSDLLHVSDFAPLLNQTFSIRFTENVVLPAELIQVNEVDGYSPIERKPFSVVFRTEQKKEYYQQAITILHHPEKGDVAIFLVPLGLDSQGMRYEAVFS
jgi:hypothetical protein